MESILKQLPQILRFKFALANLKICVNKTKKKSENLWLLVLNKLL